MATSASASPQYIENYLGTKHESATCGFQAVYVAFAIFFGFAPNNPVTHALDAIAIKELISPIYTSYLGHHTGVLIVLVQQLFQNFEPPQLATPATDDLMYCCWPFKQSQAPEIAAVFLSHSTAIQKHCYELENRRLGQNTVFPMANLNKSSAGILRAARRRTCQLPGRNNDPPGIPSTSTFFFKAMAEYTELVVQPIIHTLCVSSGEQFRVRIKPLRSIVCLLMWAEFRVKQRKRLVPR
ncbi:hypothetical protein C8J57DRAFT_1252646 [Mycena rebaudengoi]|nr:hypothetical protein C8J57DRAFT_1252646 [Mycena rebaudengoi]